MKWNENQQNMKAWVLARNEQDNISGVDGHLLVNVKCMLAVVEKQLLTENYEDGK